MTAFPDGTPATEAAEDSGRVLLVTNAGDVTPVRDLLERRGLEVARAVCADAMERARQLKPHVIVIDLTEGEHQNVVRAFRHAVGVAVIALAPADDEDASVEALESGADAVISWAASEETFAAQTAAAVRRARLSAPAAEAVDVVVDDGVREIRVFGRRVSLTALEWKLLSTLMSEPGRAWSRCELMEAVWGSSIGARSTVSAHVRRLREKIEPDPSAPILIRTVWGGGYSYQPAPFAP